MDYISVDYRVTHHVYTLINPLNETLFYVGKTSRSLEERLLNHITESKSRPKGSNEEKNELIASILASGSKPIIKAMNSVPGFCKLDAIMMGQLEINHIQTMAQEGHPLVNKRHIRGGTHYEWDRYLDYKSKGLIPIYFYESFFSKNGCSYDLISLELDRNPKMKIPKEGSLGFYLKFGESRFGEPSVESVELLDSGYQLGIKTFV